MVHVKFLFTCSIVDVPTLSLQDAGSVNLLSKRVTVEKASIASVLNFFQNCNFCFHIHNLGKMILALPFFWKRIKDYSQKLASENLKSIKFHFGLYYIAQFYLLIDIEQYSEWEKNLNCSISTENIWEIKDFKILHLNLGIGICSFFRRNWQVLLLLRKIDCHHLSVNLLFFFKNIT